MRKKASEGGPRNDDDGVKRKRGHSSVRANERNYYCYCHDNTERHPVSPASLARSMPSSPCQASCVSEGFLASVTEAVDAVPPVAVGAPVRGNEVKVRIGCKRRWGGRYGR